MFGSGFHWPGSENISQDNRCLLTHFTNIMDFRSLKKIDAHIHYNVPRLLLHRLGLEFGFQFLTVNTEVPFFPSLTEQRNIAREINSVSPSILDWVGTFGTSGWNGPNWLENAEMDVNSALSAGACAIKIWKNIGMALRDSADHFVMIDDPRFDPLLNKLESERIPVIGHLGEPRNCWLPIDRMTVRSDREYFSQHPEYHMYRHPKLPSYDAQLNARDHMLEKHPKLRFIGAHLASLEWNVHEVSQWLDRFPNTAVDLAERINHLQLQSATDHAGVIDFFESYQDRIIYGTDIIDDGSMDEQELRNELVGRWMDHWNFFTTGKELHSSEFTPAFRGLNLSPSILEKIYWKNAKAWYGI